MFGRCGVDPEGFKHGPVSDFCDEGSEILRHFFFVLF
jgi:hypothetical protein